ncbi:LLM class flavin-dependent oxidoreductase [Bacillus sp. PK3_68]|uniref:LLM class flavin-dependent oxidoreductase n=1 Tax=Bacillus sp. PK3_68 TaxID=2027408 RepID=UPI000E7444BB|nr:LLM class flavin-dependent oxidoreductase [Bacillus sp. PK3_68]RJS60074.1 LLM class flavin-dependent oxidoreductase [Bacillus sp. PK3_68]
MSLQLSILDQSPISEGMGAEEALAQTVQLARHAEALGYERFWVSEHHDASSLAGSSPEVLMAYLAAKTKAIRIGSGGVMLPHYSPYKIAENFRVLEGLAPGRIDAGIGRAPGGMPMSSLALNRGEYRQVDRFPEQIDELLAYLAGDEENIPYPGLKATPLIQTRPDVWLLGSSPASALLAAKKGLPYTFAQFINGEDGQESLAAYLNSFQPSPWLSKPKSMVAVFTICAETDEKAEWLASSLDLSLLMTAQGMKSNGTPSPEKAAPYRYSEYERKFICENRKRMVIGSPERVREQYKRISEEYQTENIMAVSIMYHFEDKLKSMELLAKAAEL